MMYRLTLLLFLLVTQATVAQPKIPWTEHGPLRVSANRRFLEHRDGTGFFWLGCTAWMLPRLKPEDVDRYLKDRAEKGFTVIQVNVTNMKSPNYANEWPFVGDERPWRTMQFNESYWKHIDYIVRKAKEYGLFVALFAWWGEGANDPDQFRKAGTPTRQFFSDPDTHNFQYGQQLGKRYNAEPHVIWVGSGEYHKMVSVMFPNNQRPMTDEHKRRLEAVVRGIKKSDQPGKHLYTMHPVSFLSSSEEFHEAEWLDFNMIQSHAIAEFIVPLTTADYNKTPTKPTFNAEGWYENERDLYQRWTGMKRSDDGPFDADWEQRYQAYWSVFSGGFGYTYGHKNIWTMKSPTDEIGVLPQEVLDAPGTRSFGYLKKLITSKSIQNRVPDPLLVSAGTVGRSAGLSPDLRIGTRADDGKWAMIYSTRGSLVRVNMDRLATGTASAFWYNPRNGTWRANELDGAAKTPFLTAIKSGKGSPAQYFDPPGDPKDANDWVLVLEVNRADRPPKKPKAVKLVFIAGPDDHCGTNPCHKYEADLTLLKKCLEATDSPVRFEIKLYVGERPSIGSLDEVAAVVVHSSADRVRKEWHALFPQNQDSLGYSTEYRQFLDYFDGQIKRGMGLMVMHYATWVDHPEAQKRLMDWVGGYYLRGKSKVDGDKKTPGTTAIETVKLARPSHEIANGVRPWTTDSEFYYNMHFDEKTPGFTPLLHSELPVDEPVNHVVAWCLERPDRGRGMVFTEGHFPKNMYETDFRTFVLNAILWTAHVDVPKRGFPSSVTKPTPK